ncbi:MAG: hypothetical protein J2P37_08535, partial [Ktedonobacteraceae bacterium]|nr:hypothetical protein [Ktedonobacteraceae bacterium]
RVCGAYESAPQAAVELCGASLHEFFGPPHLLLHTIINPSPFPDDHASTHIIAPQCPNNLSYLHKPATK